MINHVIWGAGVLGHLLLLAVLLMRRRMGAFPWFTILILFDLMRSVGLAAVLHFSGHPAPVIVSRVVDVTDILLEFAVLVELTTMALRPLGAGRRLLLSLLLLASACVMGFRLAPAGRIHLGLVLILGHFLLSVMFVEWAIVLAFLLKPLQLSWRSYVAVITFGFGVYSAALLAGGGYFTTGREMRDYVFFSFFRVTVYLLVLAWWTVRLSFSEGAARSSEGSARGSA